MKKVYILALVFVTLLSLVSCNNLNENSDNGDNSAGRGVIADIRMVRTAIQLEDGKEMSDLYYLGGNKAYAKYRFQTQYEVEGEKTMDYVWSYHEGVFSFPDMAFINNIEIPDESIFPYHPRLYFYLVNYFGIDNSDYFVLETTNRTVNGGAPNYLIYDKDGKFKRIVSFDEFFGWENDDKVISDMRKQYAFRAVYGDYLYYILRRNLIRKNKNDDSQEEILLENRDAANTNVSHSIKVYNSENIIVTRLTLFNRDEDWFTDYYYQYGMYNLETNTITFSEPDKYKCVYVMDGGAIFTDTNETEFYYSSIDENLNISEPKLFCALDKFNCSAFSPDYKYFAIVGFSRTDAENYKERKATGITINLYDTSDFSLIISKTAKIGESDEIYISSEVKDPVFPYPLAETPLIVSNYHLNVFPNGTVDFGLCNDDYAYNFILEKTET